MPCDMAAALDECLCSVCFIVSHGRMWLSFPIIGFTVLPACLFGISYFRQGLIMLRASVVLLSLAFLPWVGLAADWPEFRGPTQQGLSTETGLPTTWSEDRNVVWKTELPGRGWSSPAIVESQIWLTTALEDGRSLRALRLNLASGTIEKNVEVFQLKDPGSIHKKNSHASPTPIVADHHVYVHYGRHGTACLTTEGSILWKTQLEYDHRHGPGGSPILFQNLVIINCDGTDVQYVVALDRKTGKEVWKQFRGKASMAYSTPLLIEVNGQPQIISCGGEWTIAYEPLTGQEIWRFRYPSGYSNVPRPVAAFDKTFVSSGYNTPTLYAVKLGGSGDITETHVAWKVKKGAPRNSSPLIVGEELYMVSDNGIMTCLDVKTGEKHWEKRLGGDCSASPIYGDGKIYVTNESGLTMVIEPGKAFSELAVNKLAGSTLASLATADGALFLRTETALYRLDE